MYDFFNNKILPKEITNTEIRFLIYKILAYVRYHEHMCSTINIFELLKNGRQVHYLALHMMLICHRYIEDSLSDYAVQNLSDLCEGTMVKDFHKPLSIHYLNRESPFFIPLQTIHTHTHTHSEGLRLFDKHKLVVYLHGDDEDDEHHLC